MKLPLFETKLRSIREFDGFTQISFKLHLKFNISFRSKKNYILNWNSLLGKMRHATGFFLKN